MHEGGYSESTDRCLKNKGTPLFPVDVLGALLAACVRVNVCVSVRTRAQRLTRPYYAGFSLAEPCMPSPSCLPVADSAFVSSAVECCVPWEALCSHEGVGCHRALGEQWAGSWDRGDVGPPSVDALSPA